MRTLVTKTNGSVLGVNLTKVTIDEPLPDGKGTRLWFDAMQLEVRETQAQLWPPPRDVARELAAVSDQAAQSAAAATIAAATQQPVDQQASMNATAPQPVATEIPVTTIPIAPVPVATVGPWVDPAIWEKHAADARAAADAARTNAATAQAESVKAQNVVDDFNTQMASALRAQGVVWPGDPSAAPAEPEPAPPARKRTTKAKPKTAAKPAAKAKPKAKPPTKKTRR